MLDGFSLLERVSGMGRGPVMALATLTLALLKKYLQLPALLGIVSVTTLSGTAWADPISVCTGAGCSTTNVTGTIVAGNGTVTITLNNNLTNAQMVSVIQNVSGIY